MYFKPQVDLPKQRSLFTSDYSVRAPGVWWLGFSACIIANFVQHFLFTKLCNSSSYCSLRFPLRAEPIRRKGCCTTQNLQVLSSQKFHLVATFQNIFSGLKLLICKVYTEKKIHTFLSVNTARELNLTGKGLRKEGLGTPEEMKGVEMEGFPYSLHSTP